MPLNQRIAEFAGYRLDYGERALLSPQGGSEQLSRRLFDTLVLLVERTGQLVEKQELMRHVWAEVVVEENTLSRTISSVRQKLGDAPGEDRFIATVSGMGYRFLQPVVFSEKTQASPGRSSGAIAVLPFEDFSPQQDQRHFADGLVDELISTLGVMPELRVTARNSAFQLRGSGVRAAAQKLGVAHVITGAVRKEGERLRVSVQLIDAATEQQLWAARCEGHEQALFALQQEISQAVTEGVAPALQLPVPSKRPQRTPQAAAFDLMLRARTSAQQSGGPAVIQTCALLKQAVARDPDYAVAWAMLSFYTGSLRVFGVPVTREIEDDIERSAERAMALEPDCWPAWLAHTSQHYLQRNWIEMEHALLRARQLAGGGQAELGLSSGTTQLMVGRLHDAARAWRELVVSDPLSLIASGVYQEVLHMAGDNASAELEYARSQGLPGNRDMVEHLAIHRLWAQGRPFREQLQRYLKHQSLPLPVLHEVETVHDQPPLVVALLTQALQQPDYAPPTPQVILGWWLARYGATDTAMDVLWRVYVDGAYAHTAWLWFPAFANVRKLPRFSELLERVGLARYWQVSGMKPDVPGLL